MQRRAEQSWWSRRCFASRGKRSSAEAEHLKEALPIQHADVHRLLARLLELLLAGEADVGHAVVPDAQVGVAGLQQAVPHALLLPDTKFALATAIAVVRDVAQQVLVVVNDCAALRGA